MSNSPAVLNQRIANLYGLIAQASVPGPTTSNLSVVLANGNSATNQNITNVNNLGVTTINGLPYPPVVPADTLQAVVNAGNGISNFTPGSTASITSTNFTNNRQLLLNANADPTIKMIDNLNASHYTTFDIDTINLSGTTTNWSSIVANPTLSQVLTAGNTAVNTITLQDATTPSTLFSQMTDNGFQTTDATGSPQYDASVFPTTISVSNTNSEQNNMTATDSTILSGAGQNIISVNGMNVDNNVSITDYSVTGITAGGATSIDYQVTSNMATSTNGYARLDLTSGDLTTIQPRAVLQAFVDLNAGASYPADINSIDLGGATGNKILIANGNSDSGLGLAYNTINMVSDAFVSNSYIELKTIDAGTSAGGTLTLGQDNFSLSVTNQTAITIGQPFTDPVVFRRNISTTTNTGLGAPVGMLENSVINATTTGTTTLTTSNAFATIINTPTLAGRIFVLPAPTAGTAGYWYAVCNKSTTLTIAVQYPALTTIFTIPVAPSATNGGSVARFAVVAGGASYFTVN